MFRIDVGRNRINKLKQVALLRTGFADTKERLDLLAIDKQGASVIIENKLDDSGRNVIWQTYRSTRM